MSGASVSQRLHDQLARLISKTEPGGRLLSEPALAQELGVSRATLREAMRTFETQGIIRRKQGSGTYVNHPPRVMESGLEVLESIEKIAERSGLAVTMGEFHLDRRAANDDESAILKMGKYKEVIEVSRVIMAEKRPVAYLVDILPVEILSQEEINGSFTGSVLDVLLKRGEPSLLVSRTEINSVTASSQVARALGIQRGDVLLCFIAELYSTSGYVIDHSYSYFLPGYFRFHVIRRVG